MEKHPLHFFIDLIVGKKISDLKTNFQYEYKDEDIVEINSTDDYIQYLVHDMPGQIMIGTAKFSDFITNRMTEEKANFITTVDLHLLNTHSQNHPTFINHIAISIDDLIITLSDYPEANKYQIIHDTLTEIKELLSRRYQQSEINPQKTQSITTLPTTKLRWNAGVASLCTLFYELANEYKLAKKGISYLNASEDQLVKFITENFVDANGEPFVIDSIKTYLSHRQDKKAKRDKAEINHIIPPSSISEN